MAPAPSRSGGNWLTRSAGLQGASALAEAPGTVMSTLQEIRKYLRDADRRFALLVAPRLRDTSAQVLLRVIERELYDDNSKSTHYARLGLNHPGLASLSQSLQVPVVQLQRQADNLIDRHNAAAAHHCSLEGLDLEVAEVAGLITPELEAICSWEVKVIRNYADIKAAFPDLFGPAALAP